MKKTNNSLIALGLAVVLTVALVLAMVNFPQPGLHLNATDLSDQFKKQDVIKIDEPDGDFSARNLAFSLDLLSHNYDSNENLLLSPTSIMLALAMTQNGAGTTTLAEMETVLGGYDATTLNQNLGYYLDSLSNDDITKINNSIWLKQSEDGRWNINYDFIQRNVDYYDADFYLAPFDKSTLDDINNWIAYHTDDLVKDALDQIPANAVMYLINTILFEARWLEEFPEGMVYPEYFTDATTHKELYDFLHSVESTYLENDQVTGFVKDYDDSRYSFVALLPKNDMAQTLENLDGASFKTLLDNRQNLEVEIAIPKFEYDYKTELSDVLSAMGMPEAFTPAADFSRIGYSGDLYISRVIHSTSIILNEIGTKAGAATIVEMLESAGPVADKQVILDHPFIYAIYDNEMDLPLFMGILNQVEQ